jgi:hypothetical protein
MIRLVLATPLLLAATVWGAAALWVDGPSARPLAAVLAVGFATAMLAIALRVRPVGRALLGCGLAFLAVVAWWLSLQPSNERDWLPEVAQLPRAQIDGDLITISNVRDFRYRSEDDYDAHWDVRRYDHSQLVGVDMFLSYWGSPVIAHTIASWEFADGEHLAISIETRKERGEVYSAVLGFFRQFELYYVVADERDVVGVRTNHRGEDVYLYQLKTPVHTARAILVDYLEEVNRLAEQPEWYNALTHNCTTTIRRHAQHVAAGKPFDWRILVNGYIDQLGYERGQIDTSLPFAELRRRSHVSEKAQAAGDAADFSTRIREGLPAARAR